MEWKIIKANVEGAIYNREFKIQGSAISENTLFDPTKKILI